MIRAFAGSLDGFARTPTLRCFGQQRSRMLRPVETLAKLLEESDAVLTLDGIPIPRLREQIRAEDETYEPERMGK